MESFQINARGKHISVVIFGFLLCMISGSVYSAFYLDADWICGSGDWSELSCWDFAGYDPDDPPTIDDLYNAKLVFSDSKDRLITRSVLAPYLYYTMIDSTGSGTTALLHTGGIVGSGYTPTTTEVGVQGSGTLIQTGGTIIGGLVLGLTSGSHGTFDLVGGRTDTFEGVVHLGYGGSGLVNQTGGILASGAMRVGEKEGSSGIYNLSDGYLGMAYNGQSDISWIGYAGSGTFNQTGGLHGAATGFIIGGKETGHGTYNLSGGTARAGMLIFGDEGEGTFTQTGGSLEGRDSSSDYYLSKFLIGNQSTGHGAYNLIDGTFTMGESILMDVIVGNEGVGVINQLGGTFNIADCTINYGSGCQTYFGTGALNIAKQTGSAGTFNLAGGSTVSNGVNVGIGGDGVFNQLGGNHEIRGTLAVANATQNGTGVYTLKGGTLDADNIVVNNNGTFNFDGGSVTTDLFVNAGIVTLGDPSVDTTIVGNFVQLQDGILEFGASHTSGFNEIDRLDVTQMAILGGTLNFAFDHEWDVYANAGNYGIGEALLAFDLFSADTILGEFDFLELPDLGGLDAFFDWEIGYLLNDFDTDYVRLSMVRTASPVPEPSTLLLLLPGLAAIRLVGRKQRAV